MSDEETPTPKEVAERVAAYLSGEAGEIDIDEVLMLAELLARHVIALEADAEELLTAVSTSELAAMALQHRRYVILLEQVKADTPAKREILEGILDEEINRRDARIITAH